MYMEPPVIDSLLIRLAIASDLVDPRQAILPRCYQAVEFKYPTTGDR